MAQNARVTWRVVEFSQAAGPVFVGGANARSNDLERQLAARYEELCAALRAAPAREVVVDHWVRVTDWRWSRTPLSAAGSLNGVG
jgi:hypothetical protein